MKLNLKMIPVSLFIIGITGEIWQWMDEWQKIAAPYRVSAWFYHATFQLPLRSLGIVWSTIEYSAPTPFSNLNWLLGLVGMLVYAALLVYFASITLAKINSLGISNKKLLKWYLVPAGLSIIWLIGDVVLTWLFQTQTV